MNKDIEDVLLDEVVEKRFAASCKCRYLNTNCLNFNSSNKKCRILWNCSFVRYSEGKKKIYQCPFYKVDYEVFKYCIYDAKYDEIIEYFKKYDDARTYVKVITDPYASGEDDERFFIMKNQKYSWKVKENARKFIQDVKRS